LENFLSNFKKNKGLMFTTLSIISVVGIFLSLYFVSYLVKDVAHKTYKNQQKRYSSELKTYLSKEKDLVLAISSTTSLDSKLIKLYKNDLNITENDINNEFKKIAKKYMENINKNLNRKDIKINYFISEKNDGENIINGIIVKNTGTYFQAKMPFAQKDNTYLKIEVLSNIENLKNLYTGENRKFVYLLNNSSKSKLDRTVFKKLYKKINNKYSIKTLLYPQELINNIQSIDFNKLNKQGYIKLKDYYFTAVNIYDVTGSEIGLILIGEKIDDNSLVKLVKNLVNNVTMVALGLIVSMILFLF
jgi:hypothetical protein